MANWRARLRKVLLLSLTIFACGLAFAQDDATRAVTDLVDRAEAKCQDLAKRLAACRAHGQDITLPDGTLAVAELFCRYSRIDAADPNLRSAALNSMKYVDAMLDEGLHRADAVLAGKASYPSIPKWSTVGVTWHDGGFWVGGQPIFLSGYNWDAVVTDGDPILARRLGITLADGMLRGGQKQDGSWDEGQLRDGDGPYLGRMAQAGFAVDCLFGISVPGWLMDANPGMREPGYSHYGDLVIDHPKTASFLRDCLDHFMPPYAAYPSLFAVNLDNEPAYQAATSQTMNKWRVWLQRKYHDIAGLNRAWGVTYASFADVKRFPSQVSPMSSPWDRANVDFTQPGVRGAHYDWCIFNNGRVTEYYRGVVEGIHAHAPKVATHVKMMLSLFFTGSTESRGWKMGLSYHTFGVDPEALAKFCDLLGGDVGLSDLSKVEKPNRYFGSVPYAVDWLTAGLAADFLKSLAPDKPFYDSEFHAIEEVDQTDIKPSAQEHLRTALWLGHLHGMYANLLWYWGREMKGSVMGAEWFKGSLLQQPWALRGYVEESLSLRRFVRPVMAFSRGSRRVRLLYSEASAIQDVGYLDALRDAYEALNFLGLPIGFVTERQLAEGGVPADTRLLVVPDARYVEDSTVAALKIAARRGVKVGILGDQSLTAEPTGGPRVDASVPGAEHLALGEPQVYQPRFDAWMRAAGIQRDLLAMGPDGQPAWGIEVRTASQGGQRLAYLINLMREPVRVALRWSVKDAHLQDWRTDTRVPDQVTLQPRQVVFGAY